MSLASRVLVLSLALFLARVGPARAQTVAPEAKQHLDRGLRSYALQEYAQAIVEFKAGYEIDPQPVFLYALAQAERLSGDCTRAVKSYEAFLRSGPPERQADSARQNLERCQAALRAHPPGAPPTESAPAPGEAAPGAPAPANPPAAPAAVPTVGATSPPRTPWYKDTLGDVLVGSGVAALVGGGILWKVGRDAIDEANGAPSYDAFAQRYEQARTTAHTEQTVGVVTMAAGGALVAAGIVRYLLRGSAPADPAVEMAATPGPGGALVELRARF